MYIRVYIGNMSFCNQHKHLILHLHEPGQCPDRFFSSKAFCLVIFYDCALSVYLHCQENYSVQVHLCQILKKDSVYFLVRELLLEFDDYISFK